MLSIRRTLIGAALTVGMLAQVQQAVALTFDLDTTFSGTPPDNTYSATFSSSCGAGCVRLTMSITGTSVTEFIDGNTSFGWGFNFNPAKAPTLLNFTFVSGQQAQSISTGVDFDKADGDGFFDIVFGFDSAANTGNRFTAGETSVYDITLAGLTVADFNFSSLCGQGCGEGSFFSAAHVQGIGPSDNSGWIGDGDGGGNGVPEPRSLLLLGSAALAAAGLSLRKRGLV